MEIVYVKIEKSRKGSADGYFIKYKKGYIPIRLISESQIESFGKDAQEYSVIIDKDGQLIHEAIKRVEVIQ